MQTCIWRAGSHPCPAPFSTARGWATAADTRACTPCTCGSPSASGCSVTTTLYSDPDCKTELSAVTDGQCTQQAAALSLLATVTPGSATCAPSGGTPTGAASASQALTVCCAP